MKTPSLTSILNRALGRYKTEIVKLQRETTSLVFDSSNTDYIREYSDTITKLYSEAKKYRTSRQSSGLEDNSENQVESKRERNGRGPSYVSLSRVYEIGKKYDSLAGNIPKKDATYRRFIKEGESKRVIRVKKGKNDKRVTKVHQGDFKRYLKEIRRR